MGSKTVFYIIETEKSLSEVIAAARKSFSLLGGTIMPASDGLQITQGINGVNFAFAADFTTYLNIRQAAPTKYEAFCTINWKPNGIFWACLIIGFCVVGVLWIIPLLYLFIDPSAAYQQALLRIPSFLS